MILSPRMHGLPPLFSGSRVMRSKWSILYDTRRPDRRSNLPLARISHEAQPGCLDKPLAVASSEAETF